MEDTRLIARNVRPFWGRVAVARSTVDEIQLDSGVVLPLEHDDDEDVERGIVLYVDDSWDESAPQHRTAAQQIAPGTVVYFRGGVTIRDVVIVEMNEILAREED